MSRKRDLMVAAYRLEDLNTKKPLSAVDGGKPVIYLFSKDKDCKALNKV